MYGLHSISYYSLEVIQVSYDQQLIVNIFMSRQS